ncbi:TetR/AcrR family transcriptional regulator [Sinomonas susongensis]|uniref:TetR/AcrR family transcriptional regulator n=1 Tax=Sinomonas susongensis TaxID=1324851 RepID=UPI0011094FEA|nr:TetR/AcrR family transcriptional regulator [Sinomonas susongensis]
MSESRPGRPRAQRKVRPGASAREEILDAAAELFTTRGYAQTSTRAIAEAVGMRQSSLYHHFPTKDEILEALLAETVSGSLEFARRLAQGLPADDGDHRTERAARLYTLSLYDGTELCSAQWNLGVLYHLPEARAERFAAFLGLRRELRDIYEQLSPRPERPGTGDLVFRLVESLISLRADGLAHADSAQETADAGLRLLGLEPDAEKIRRRASELLGPA